MSTKRGKLTAGKARERVASLEESISARQQRLDQLNTRLERSESPDERLLTAKTRLERRLVLERDQLEKLQKLLSRPESTQPEESGEYFASEEIDDLHRSFEEVRHNLAQMQARIESTEMPRDLSSRLTSFEERVARREEVDSELFGQVLALQNGLDQERQTVRRLSRRSREQDQSLDALREAVEDSVVATVDLAQRLEELEEAMSENAESKNGQAAAQPSVSHSPSMTWNAEIETLRELVEDARRGLLGLQKQVVESLEQAAHEREELRTAQVAFSQKQAEAEAQALADAESLAQARQSLAAAQASLAEQIESVQAQARQALDLPTSATASAPIVASGLTEEALAPLLARLEGLERAALERPVTPIEFPVEVDGPKPAVFAHNGAHKKRVALFGVRPPATEPAAQPVPFLVGDASFPRTD